MKKQSLTAFILSALIIFSAYGCSDNTVLNNEQESVQSDNASAQTETETEAETEDLYNDDLEPEDFEGYEFRINVRDTPWIHGTLLVEELNGEVLNDAMYRRQNNVAEKFNVVFKEEAHGDGGSFMAKKSILSNDDAYDLLSTRCTAVIAFVGNGLVLEMADLPYINLDKAYWYKDITKDVNIGDKVYYPMGDICLSLLDMTNVLCFNKQMITDFELENPYELVRNKKWTMDKHLEMAAKVVSDLNGDGVMDENDRYGSLGATKLYGYSMLMAHNVKSVNKDKDNIPVFDAASNEKFINAFNHTVEILFSSGQWFDTKTGGQGDPVINAVFKGGHALFFGVVFSELEALRDMETDFGVIPYPMENESVGRYYSRANWFEPLMVPITVSDPGRTSKIIEALAAESGRLVYPAYYDIAVSNKTTRDEESREMLNIIKESRIIDLGDNIWCDQIRDGFMGGLLESKGENLVSQLTARTEPVSAYITKTVTRIEEANS